MINSFAPTFSCFASNTFTRQIICRVTYPHEISQVKPQACTKWASTKHTTTLCAYSLGHMRALPNSTATGPPSSRTAHPSTSFAPTFTSVGQPTP